MSKWRFKKSFVIFDGEYFIVKAIVKKVVAQRLFKERKFDILDEWTPKIPKKRSPLTMTVKI